MTPNTHLGRLQNNLKTMIFKFYHGQHGLQALTPLNTSGNISNDNFINTATHPKKHMNSGIGRLMSGMELDQKYVKIS